MVLLLSLLLGLTGILAGLALSFIAPEEIKPGWDYFKISKLTLFVILVAVISYSLWSRKFLVGLGIFVIIAVTLFIINLKFKYKWIEILNYALFIIAYFFQSEPSQPLIASLLFLYGLPSGTLLRNIHHETKK